MNWSLKNILLVPAAIIIAISMSVSTTVSYLLTENALEESTTEEIKSISNNAVDGISSWLKDRNLDLNTWRQQTVFLTSLKGGFVARSAKKNADAIVARWKEEYGYYNALHLVSKKGEIVSSTVPIEAREFRFIDEAFYKKALEGETVSTEVSNSPVNQKPSIRVYLPVENKGKIVGVFVGDIYFGYVSEKFISTIKIGKTGYGLIVGPGGTILSHPSRELVLAQNITTLPYGKYLTNGGEGIAEFSTESGSQLLGFVTMPDTNWTIAVNVYKDELMESAKLVGKMNAGAAIAIIILLNVAIFVITKYITRQIDQVSDQLNTIAHGEGDLTCHIEPQGCTEVQHLANGFNQFVGQTRTLISQVKDASIVMDSTMVNLSNSTAVLVSTNDSINAESQCLASSAEEMRVTVDEVARNAESAGEASQTASDVLSTGVKKVEQAIAALQTISDVVGNAGSRVQSLAEQLDGMTSVVRVIEGVAEQTNLLALNAAIEAARAGEQGRGFAVVAEQVRELANKTVTATHEIGQSISKIQGDSQSALDAVQQGLTAVTEGVELGQSAESAIHEIDEHVANTSGQTIQIASATTELSLTIGSMVRTIEEIASKIESNRSSLSDIYETTESTTAKAAELNGLTSQFKT